MAQLRSIFVLSLVVASALALTPAADAADYTLEGEAMTVSPASAGRIITDSTASGGRRLVLQTNSVASSTVSVPASTRVVVVARSQDCRGSAKMTVALDGSTIKSATLSNKDAQYAVSVSMPAGSHTIAVAYTNDYKTFM